MPRPLDPLSHFPLPPHSPTPPSTPFCSTSLSRSLTDAAPPSLPPASLRHAVVSPGTAVLRFVDPTPRSTPGSFTSAAHDRLVFGIAATPPSIRVTLTAPTSTDPPRARFRTTTGPRELPSSPDPLCFRSPTNSPHSSSPRARGRRGPSAAPPHFLAPRMFCLAPAGARSRPSLPAAAPCSLCSCALASPLAPRTAAHFAATLLLLLPPRPGQPPLARARAERLQPRPSSPATLGTRVAGPSPALLHSTPTPLQPSSSSPMATIRCTSSRCTCRAHPQLQPSSEMAGRRAPPPLFSDGG
nr:proline-rich protein 36-like [Aegilops tauschii subsp. strangulata]